MQTPAEFIFDLDNLLEHQPEKRAEKVQGMVEIQRGNDEQDASQFGLRVTSSKIALLQAALSINAKNTS